MTQYCGKSIAKLFNNATNIMYIKQIQCSLYILQNIFFPFCSGLDGRVFGVQHGHQRLHRRHLQAGAAQLPHGHAPLLLLPGPAVGHPGAETYEFKSSQGLSQEALANGS